VISFLGDLAKNAILDKYFGDEFFRVDSKMTMFRLEHKDPTLEFLVLSDLFHSIHPTESGGYEKTVMDVFDAVQSHQIMMTPFYGQRVILTTNCFL
jgi:hypothetical protein